MELKKIDWIVLGAFFCLCSTFSFFAGALTESHLQKSKPAERIAEAVSDARLGSLQARIEAIEARLERRKIGEKNRNEEQG